MSVTTNINLERSDYQGFWGVNIPLLKDTAKSHNNLATSLETSIQTINSHLNERVKTVDFEEKIKDFAHESTVNKEIRNIQDQIAQFNQNRTLLATSLGILQQAVKSLQESKENLVTKTELAEKITSLAEINEEVINIRDQIDNQEISLTKSADITKNLQERFSNLTSKEEFATELMTKTSSMITVETNKLQEQLEARALISNVDSVAKNLQKLLEDNIKNSNSDTIVNLKKQIDTLESELVDRIEDQKTAYEISVSKSMEEIGSNARHHESNALKMKNEYDTILGNVQKILTELESKLSENEKDIEISQKQHSKLAEDFNYHKNAHSEISESLSGRIEILEKKDLNEAVPTYFRKITGEHLIQKAEIDQRLELADEKNQSVLKDFNQSKAEVVEHLSTIGKLVAETSELKKSIEEFCEARVNFEDEVKNDLVSQENRLKECILDLQKECLEMNINVKKEIKELRSELMFEISNQVDKLKSEMNATSARQDKTIEGQRLEISSLREELKYQSEIIKELRKVINIPSPRGKISDFPAIKKFEAPVVNNNDSCPGYSSIDTTEDSKFLESGMISLLAASNYESIVENTDEQLASQLIVEHEFVEAEEPQELDIHQFYNQ